MWIPLLDELLAEEQQCETLRLAEYARMVSAVCDQAGPWRSTRRSLLCSIGHLRARIDGIVEENTVRTEHMGRPASSADNVRGPNALAIGRGLKGGPQPPHDPTN